MIPPPSSHARDAGLRRLVLAKRWLLAGSVTLTGVLTAVAANAFPGKTIKSSGARAANAGHSSKTSTHQNPKLVQFAETAGASAAIHHSPGTCAGPRIDPGSRICAG